MLIDAEKQELDELLQRLFGFHILQIGSVTHTNLLTKSKISHRVIADLGVKDETSQPSVYAYGDALPIATDSVDVALLHHTLEFEKDPHSVLREVDRILIPDGHIVIVGFNPWSFWGMRRVLRRRRCSPPWCGRFFSLVRVRDWMALLGFDVIEVRHRFFRPPIKRAGLMRRLAFMDRVGQRLCPHMAAVYIVVAKKRISTLTPIKPRWRPRRRVVSGVVEPT